MMRTSRELNKLNLILLMLRRAIKDAGMHHQEQPQIQQMG